jgi:6-pyruvoyltetrahydropterin/6-carboxytetrahydropterin synthase
MKGENKMIVSKKVSMEVAHFLPQYDGPCRNLHGHRLVVELGVDGPVKEDGMVIDFKLLKCWLNDFVVEVFDHHLINDIIPNPTAENIASWIAEEFNTICQREFGVDLAFVRVWETENSCVEWRPK